MVLILSCLLAAYRLPASDFRSVAGLKPEPEILHGHNYLTMDNDLSDRPSPLLEHFRKKRNGNRRLTAALIAFPFPFGIVGLHRIYLGCAPYVPVVYIASLGGAFGLLPLIDCVVLLADKNLSRYENNASVFMWIR